MIDNMKEKIQQVYFKIPGVVSGTGPNSLIDVNYMRWLIAMGMYDTLKITANIKVWYG